MSMRKDTNDTMEPPAGLGVEATSTSMLCESEVEGAAAVVVPAVPPLALRLAA